MMLGGTRVATISRILKSLISARAWGHFLAAGWPQSGGGGRLAGCGGIEPRRWKSVMSPGVRQRAYGNGTHLSHARKAWLSIPQDGHGSFIDVNDGQNESIGKMDRPPRQRFGLWK